MLNITTSNHSLAAKKLTQNLHPFPSDPLAWPQTLQEFDMESPGTQATLKKEQANIF